MPRPFDILTLPVVPTGLLVIETQFSQLREASKTRTEQWTVVLVPCQGTCSASEAAYKAYRRLTAEYYGYGG